MAMLVAIGYPDQATAEQARQTVQGLEADLVILGVGVFMYVLLDGFDLGVGILFPFVRDEDLRSLMMSSVAPVWDGNETWLVLGGVVLLARDLVFLDQHFGAFEILGYLVELRLGLGHIDALQQAMRIRRAHDPHASATTAR